MTKLIQRIGMIFLPPRVASWRYQRGQRSLVNNLAGKGSNIEQDVKDDGQETNTSNEEDDIEVPDEMDEIFEYLLSALGNSLDVIKSHRYPSYRTIKCETHIQI